MENLNAENVKKWLEICAEDTPYPDQSKALHDALALINSQEQRIGELAEENESLKTQRRVLAVGLKDLRKEIKAIKADTARKMQERLKAHFDTYTDEDEATALYMRNLIDQIAKEMSEGENV